MVIAKGLDSLPCPFIFHRRNPWLPVDISNQELNGKKMGKDLFQNIFYSSCPLDTFVTCQYLDKNWPVRIYHPQIRGCHPGHMADIDTRIFPPF